MNKLFLYFIVVVIMILCLTDLMSIVVRYYLYRNIKIKRLHLFLEVILLLTGGIVLYLKAGSLLVWLYES